MKKSLPLLMLILLSACSVEDPNDTGTSQLDQQEKEQQDKQDNTALNASVKLLSDAQLPISNATIQSGELELTSNANGEVDLSQLSLGNHIVEISHPDYLPLVMTVSLNEKDTQEFDVTLTPRSSSVKTLLFAGDTMFGRRYFNPELITMGNSLPSSSDALIQPSTAAQDARNIVRFMHPLFDHVDFASVNLESPVLENPTSVHPTKEYAFFSLPDSLSALNDLNIDYVALGNNHVYDYLDAGLDDTLMNVERFGLQHSGAGTTATAAYAPFTMALGETTLSLISATSITGEKHDISYIATDSKAGAADLTNTEALRNTIVAAKSNDQFVITQLHGGDEYSYAPTAYIDNRFKAAAQSGADLMIAHHPHVAQGFAVYDGVPAILGLGNFVFEQARLETFLGVITVVELDTAGEPTINSLKAYPVYLEDYVPKLVSGDLSNLLLKRIAEFSAPEVGISLHSGYAEVTFDKPVEPKASHQKTLILEPGEHIIDLRQYAQSHQFLSKLQSSSDAVELTLGRDLLFFGDFEDWDTDDEIAEVSRWLHEAQDISPCLTGAYRGSQGLCLQRTQYNETATRVPFKHTVRTMPITPAASTQAAYHELSLFGYAKGSNAGELSADIRILTPEDSLIFSETFPVLKAAGDYDWQSFRHDITLPDDSVVLSEEAMPARGVQFGLAMQPPASGEAALLLDDMAMISWQRPLQLESQQWQTKQIHGFEFIAVKSSETVELTLSFSQQ